MKSHKRALKQAGPPLCLLHNKSGSMFLSIHHRNILAVVNCASAPPDKDVDWARVAAKFGFVVPCFHVEPHGEQEPLQYMLVHVKDEVGLVSLYDN